MRHKKVKNVYREIYNVIYNINNMDRYSIFCLCRSSLEAQAAEKIWDNNVCSMFQ